MVTDKDLIWVVVTQCNMCMICQIEIELQKKVKYSLLIGSFVHFFSFGYKVFIEYFF